MGLILFLSIGCRNHFFSSPIDFQMPELKTLRAKNTGSQIRSYFYWGEAMASSKLLDCQQTETPVA